MFTDTPHFEETSEIINLLFNTTQKTVFNINAAKTSNLAYYNSSLHLHYAFLYQAQINSVFTHSMKSDIMEH